MPKEKSVGAVAFRVGEEEPLFLLLHYGAGHWDFPKGHVEPGETEPQTMLRELEEETGITEVDVVEGFRKPTSYFFRSGGETVFKEVVFYLLESKTEKVRISHEHKGFKWLPFGDALRLITYKNSKDVLSAANDFLLQKAMPRQGKE